jgi:hypothetical protein
MANGNQEFTDKQIKAYLKGAEHVVGSNTPFATKRDEKRFVKVCGDKFICRAQSGVEYIKESGGLFTSGYPFAPFKYQKVILGKYLDYGDDSRVTVAYLIDAKGIIWVNYKEGLSRPCYTACIHYIHAHDPDNYNNLLVMGMLGGVL